jgi:alkylation response protein AidB-like acyl-CoA dehydrogenase
MAMDYWLTDEQQQFRDSVRRWLDDEYLPLRKLTHMTAAADFAVARWREWGELGWLGASFAEEFGGSGGSLAETALVLEEFGRALLPSPYLTTVGLAGHLLRAAGSEAQKRELLPQLCEGRQRFAVALDRGLSGEDRGEHCVVSGRIALVHDLPVAQQVIVAVHLASRPGHAAGRSLYVLPVAAKGLSMERCRLQDGREAAVLVLNEADALAGKRLGPPRGADALIAEAEDVGAALSAMDAVGALWALHDLTLQYLKTRKQFGQTLGSFQALQHRMVDIHTHCQMAQSLAMEAVAAIERDPPELRAQAVSAAKIGVGQAARRVGEEAVQLHGGIGMTLEYAAGHYLKRLTQFRAGFGDERHHLRRYAAALAVAEAAADGEL